MRGSWAGNVGRGARRVQRLGGRTPGGLVLEWRPLVWPMVVVLGPWGAVVWSNTPP